MEPELELKAISGPLNRLLKNFLNSSLLEKGALRPKTKLKIQKIDAKKPLLFIKVFEELPVKLLLPKLTNRRFLMRITIRMGAWWHFNNQISFRKT